MANKTRRLPISIIIVVILSFGTGLTFYSEALFTTTQQSWLKYADRTYRLEESFFNIHRHIGYGGFIHHLKKLILRRDLSRYEKQIDKDIIFLRQALETLNAELQEPSDKKDISVIRNTFEKYISKYQIVKQMITEGVRPEIIENYVAVDDNPALDAFLHLQQRVKERLKTAKLEEDVKHHEAVQLMWLSRFVLIIAILISGIIIYRYERRLTYLLEEAKVVENTMIMAGFGFWEVDLNDLEHGKWSEVTRQIHEVPDDYIINPSKGINFFKEGENRETMTYVFTEAMEKGKPYDVELEIITYKDNRRWVRTVGIPVLEKGKVKKIYGLFRDISERKQIELNYLQACNEAIQANKAKSDFLSSMSHELRTPLNAILGFSQLLEMEDNLDSDQKEDVQEIIKAGSHLLNLIEEILDMSQIESGKIRISLQSVKLDSISQEAITLVHHSAENRNISIHCQGLEEVTVIADNLRLKQVLLNLLSNAIKYNRQGGKITLSANIKDEAVRINITDTGLGIEKTKISQVFDVFNRLGKECTDIEGTGIGLALTKHLIELMGGSIGVNSRDGEGSCFWIELPLCIK